MSARLTNINTRQSFNRNPATLFMSSSVAQINQLYVDRWQVRLKIHNASCFCFSFCGEMDGGNSTKSICAAISLVTFLSEYQSVPSVPPYTDVWMCLWVRACSFMYMSKFHLCHELWLCDYKTAPSLWSSKTASPKRPFLLHPFCPPRVFYTSPSFGAQIAWLFSWNWSVGTWVGQGEQTARMPCGFLMAYFSALRFWRGARRVHSW